MKELEINKKSQYGQGWKVSMRGKYVIINPNGSDHEIVVRMVKGQSMEDVIRKIEPMLNEKTFEV